VIPTAAQAVPLLSNFGPHAWRAIRAGIAQADTQQPERDERDNYYWSHTARFYNKSALRIEHAKDRNADWKLVEDVPNTGIHVLLADVHYVRVLKSLNGTAPNPGRNRQRRNAWVGVQPPEQGRLLLTRDCTLTTDDSDAFPALNVIVDWHLDEHAEPVVHVGIPAGPWDYAGDLATYAASVRMHWRVPLPGSEAEYENLRFSSEQAGDDFTEILHIDDDETGDPR
jgi:hypothetical protein